MASYRFLLFVGEVDPDFFFFLPDVNSPFKVIFLEFILLLLGWDG